MYEASKQWVKQVQAYTKSVGKASEFLYLNYADRYQDPIAAYGEDSVKYLQQISQKYDKTGVFQRAVKGGFKIPGMSGGPVKRHDEL